MKRLSFRAAALAVLLAINAAVWIAVRAESRDAVLVSFLDVGQGDAILIRGTAGNKVLIDGGGGAQVLRRLGEELPYYDRTIDAVIATHPDLDHIGGLPAVLERYDVGVLLEPGVSSDGGMDDELARAAERKGVRRMIARQGTVIDLGGGAKLSILFPDRDAAGLETNMASIVARLDYGATSFLFTGDSPQAIEGYLAARDPGSLRADVLKVGHHGSRTSTSRAFASAVSPRFAVISAGKDNEFGHPHKEVLDILSEQEVETVATMDEGTVTFESDGREVTRK